MGTAEILGECIHGLTYAWCADCKTKTPKRVKNEKAWRREGLPSFPHTEAKFDASCPWCGDEIEEGKDLVFLCDHDWICEECANDYDDTGTD